MSGLRRSSSSLSDAVCTVSTPSSSSRFTTSSCSLAVASDSASACSSSAGAYGAWFHATYQRVGIVGANGVFLYARTMSFADCAVMRPPPDLAVLCDPRPPFRRPPSQDYIWSPASPLVALPGITFTEESDDLAGRFALLAIVRQPLEYAGSVLGELSRLSPGARAAVMAAQR